MKRKLLFFAIISCTFLSLSAQIYTPNGTIQGSSGSNNVGIGTAVPDTKLDVNGTITVRQQGYGTYATPYETVAFKSFVDDANAFPFIGFLNNWQNSNRSWMNFNVRGYSGERITAMTIDGSGYVGIGTNLPVSILHIQTNNSERATGFFGATGSGTAGLYFDASDGDFSGSDYAWLLQLNDLSVELSNASANPINFKIANLTRMTISGNGNVGIGTTTPGDYKLNVWGNIRAHEVVVNTSGADFVFASEYKLLSLHEVEKFINENKHLPDLASATEMNENGMNISEMQTKLLQKIEELTLYLIELKKENEYLGNEIDELKKK